MRTCSGVFSFVILRGERGVADDLGGAAGSLSSFLSLSLCCWIFTVRTHDFGSYVGKLLLLKKIDGIFSPLSMYM